LSPNAPESVYWVVGGTEQSARIIEADLRQASMTVRVGWLADLDELSDALERSLPDLLLCYEYLPGEALTQALALCRRLAPSLRLLSLGPAPSPLATIEALKLGAADRVSIEDEYALEHLEQVCRREHTIGRTQRELQQLRPRLSRFEARRRERLIGSRVAAFQLHGDTVSFANASAAKLLGYDSPAALLGLSIDKLLSADHQPRVREQLRQLARGLPLDRALAVELLSASGTAVPVEARLSMGSDESQELIEWQLGAEAEDTASSRQALFALLAEADETARDVVLVVIDHYPALESRVGLQDAEQFMAQVDRSLCEQFGDPSRVFRFSGNEWIVVTATATDVPLSERGERLQAQLSGPIYSGAHHQSRLSVTVCAQAIGNDALDAGKIDSLVREGRQLSASTPGRSVVLGVSAADVDHVEQSRRAEQLRRALDGNRMKLAYQSIASLEGDPRLHADVLVRMLDDDGQELHARDFIPAARQFGLVSEVDRWVTGRALAVLAKRELNPAPALLMIKLADETVQDSPAFLEWLPSVLGARKLLHRELCFAIRESTAHSRLMQAQTLADGLEAAGAGLAIEHFGLDAQSHALIGSLPLRFLRFAPDFARQFGDASLRARMADLIKLARQYKVKTIVSHVEDANVMARMWQMGVDYIQGYYIQEPDVVLLSTDAIRR
jgi:EAL domain-containing protein (putative c-di-GMP-specific phosphodiesterase class I)/GGDEF domain-containing protein